MRFLRITLAILVLSYAGGPGLAASRPAKGVPKHARNVVIFVADGLRYDSVTPKNAPTLWHIRHEGVDFANSHSIYPTLTTANASAIATGHYLGDTGDYANTIYVGYPVHAHLDATVTFLEDDAILHDVKQHFGNDYLGQTTLLQAARAHGMSTAVIGKLGPAAIQDLSALDGKAILIDDVTNRPNGSEGLPSGASPLDPNLAAAIAAATGNQQVPLPAFPNTEQQKYLRAATAQAVLPYLKKSGKPFALFFWSRDPDTTQHQQQDSLGSLIPGINGPTSAAAVANADASLKAILDGLQAQGLAGTTDVFVTADHGFTTIAKSAPTPAGDPGRSHLPQGFMALAVSNWLGMNLYDPDAANALLGPDEHPSRGSGLIGSDPNTPAAIVAANGGSDLIWFSEPNARAHAKTVFDQLMKQDYVSGIFMNDALIDQGDPNEFAGALRMSDVALIGSSHVPEPSIVINFRSFPIKGCAGTVLLCTAEIADTNLTVGQGMHGSFSRAETRNFMAAIGPDFKAHYVDPAPVSNADITPTLASALGLTLPPKGDLRGRVVAEAFKGGKLPIVSRKVLRSQPGPGGLQTVVDMQLVGRVRYFDAAGFPGRTVGLSSP
jgi:arylsulfatase A-like enzyme